MKRISVIVIGLALLLVAIVLILVLVFPLSSVAAPAIRIEPPSIGRLAVGSVFTVNVTVENTVNIYAVQVDMRYDPQVLIITGITEGPFLSSTGPTATLNNTAQPMNTTPPTARVIFVDTKLGNDTKDASGNGTLFTLTFQVLSNGSTPLQFYPYPGGDLSVGTFLEKRDLTEILA